MTVLLRATKTASTYRRSGSSRTEAVNLTGLSITPLYPADVGQLGQMQMIGIINSVVNIFTCFVVGSHDILQGDELEVSGDRYVVRGVADWNARALQPLMQLTLEKVRK